LIEKVCEMHMGRTSASMDKDKNERLKKGLAMGQLFRSKSVADQELAAELIAKMEKMLQVICLFYCSHIVDIILMFKSKSNQLGNVIAQLPVTE